MENGMIEKLLIEHLATLNRAVADLRSVIEQKQGFIVDLKREIGETVSTLQGVCKHIETEIHNAYVPGGYDYTSTTTYTTVCSTCFKELDTRTEHGGYQ
jgi:hypothetical protein